MIEQAFCNVFSEEELDKIAKKTGFIKRNRKISASAFTQSLIFSEDNHEKLSLLDLKFDLVSSADINISKVALHKRFSPEAVSFLAEILSKLLSINVNINQIQNSSENIFSGIFIKDSTKFRIPIAFTNDYPSFGSYGKYAALMNIQYEFELISGNCQCLDLTKATRNDQRDSKETINDIKVNGLYLRDLGYITMTYLNAIEKEEAYYLNRLPKIGVFQKTDDKFQAINWNKINKIFKTSNLECFEMDVYIGKKDKLKTRLVIVPVPDEVAKERIKKAEKGGKRKKGYKISKEYRIKAHYNLYITNIPYQILPTKKIIETYRLRWQVELVFKTWKSNLNIHKYKTMKIERFKCQLIARLIWVLMNTKLFQITNEIIRRKDCNNGCSIVKFFKWIKKLSQEFRFIVQSENLLTHWFLDAIIPIIDELKIEKRLRKKTHCEILSSFLPY